MPEATTTLDREQTIARLASHLRDLYANDRETFNLHFPILPAAVSIHLGATIATAPAVPLLKLASMTQRPVSV